MESATIVLIAFGIILLLNTVGLLLIVLAVGGLIQNYEAHKKGVVGLANTADRAFASDRKRLAEIERFIVVAFKLDEIFGFKKPEAPDLEGQVNPKKNELKN